MVPNQVSTTHHQSDLDRCQSWSAGEGDVELVQEERALRGVLGATAPG